MLKNMHIAGCLVTLRMIPLFTNLAGTLLSTWGRNEDTISVLKEIKDMRVEYICSY